MGTAQSSEDNKVKTDETLEVKKLERIKLHVQDVEYNVNTEDITPNTTLNYYLRHILNLTGTKIMCREGGCGVCIVVLQRKDPITGKNVFLAVNSCLVFLLSCNDWRIFTIEGIGNPLEGFHKIQEILAAFNGTQCGFCSPAMVMNMFALYKSGKLTMAEVENSFGGNICRCTGYRPILSAFKSLCTDASTDILGHYPDIEDLKLCQKSEKIYTDVKESVEETEPYYHLFEKSRWVKVHTLRDLLKTLTTYAKLSYRLIAGSTAQGVYRSYAAPVDLYIEVTSIPELIVYSMNDEWLVLGGNTTLTDALEVFTKVGSEHPNFSYLQQLARHIDLVAHVPVRNRGTLAGNLMIKHDHNEFPSDIFLILETAGASLTIVSASGEQVTISPNEFLRYNMKQKVLQNVILPKHPPNVKYLSYKIMPRAQNALAQVNAGFLFKFRDDRTLDGVSIVYGNINPTFVHATQTENYLIGKNLFDNNVLQQVYASLANEVNPNLAPPDPSPEFKRELAIALFYKAVLTLAPTNLVSPRNRSGAPVLERPISRGTQDYETHESLYPLTKPIAKIEALAQTSGQAQYVDDMPDLPQQLYGALVLADATPNSIITAINPRKALEREGIVAFFSKDDIPGDNNFTPIGLSFVEAEEEIFCSARVQYYEQPIGILVGKNENAVLEASNLVEVTYIASNVEPLLSTRQILNSGRRDRLRTTQTVTPKRRGTDIKNVIKGNFNIGLQYHFHMENQCCNVVPTEDGLDIFPSTQWMDLTQLAIARMLKIPNNRINVTVRRCGGGFGAKISRNGLVACAAALASWKLRQPVKLSLPLVTNMAALGKRWPLYTEYEVGVNDRGVIQYLNSHHYTDTGAVVNEDNAMALLRLFRGIYDSDTFAIEVSKAVTDTHTNTWVRAPGTNEGLASIETIIEHIAYSLNLDPVDVRLANYARDSALPRYVAELKTWANVDKRKQEIAIFNEKNRWKKRGIAVSSMSYEVGLTGPFSAAVSIFHGDGTVQVSHGGVEIGQGINTKAAQVCAYKLGIPLEKVHVIPSHSFVAPNITCTTNSITSEAVCYGIIQACDTLLQRIKPYQNKYKNASWEEIIQRCFVDYVDLSARGQYAPTEVTGYSVYGICASEVLVDILTGQHLVLRVDIIEDTGQSMSPVIDIGQVEGAFVMGMGYYTSEQVVFNYEGKILTRNTWTYEVPGAKDIPINFNVKFPKNNPNPVGILKSKATGEPPFCLSLSVPLAIRNALASARTDADSSSTRWYPIDGPTTVENIFLNSLNKYEQYTL